MAASSPTLTVLRTYLGPMRGAVFALGALLLTGQLPLALTVFSACFLVGAVAAWGIGVETRGQHLPEVVS